MGRHREERARVLGPYYVKSRDQWRIIVVHNPAAERAEDRQAVAHYPTEAAALEEKQRIEESICNVTIDMAIKSYETFLAEKETIGYEETIRRLLLFFPDHEMMVGRITAERGKKWYDAFRARKKKDGETISVSYHRAALINARSMLSYCVEQKWLPENPFVKVKGVGKRKSGKRKPTGNELRTWYAYVWQRAKNGHEPALAVVMELAMALRSSDITRRLVRDVDLDGTQLIIEDGKSEKSNEPRFIPDELQPLVLRLIAGRKPTEPLFKTTRTDDGHHGDHWIWQAMERFCRLAGVPHFPPHALKGISGTILAKRGAAGNLVMEHLSHEDEKTTRRHYVDSSVIEAAQAEKAFKVISGGKR